MASIILTGDLQDPNSSFSAGDKVRFIHQTTTGNTIKGAVSIEEMPLNGDYTIELQYGNILVEYKDILSSTYVRIGVVTVNQDSTATSLPELLNAIVPPTDEQLLEFQAILANCVTAEDGAVTARNEAEAFAATLDLINDLSQAYEFDTIDLMVSSPVVFPVKKTLKTKGSDATGDGGGASYLIVASQPADEDRDHTLSNGNVAVKQSTSGQVNAPWNNQQKDTITCIPRVITGVAELLNDANHETLGFSGIQQNGDYELQINYSESYDQVNSLIVSIDNELAPYGLWCGGSVGTSNTKFKVYGQITGTLTESSFGSTALFKFPADVQVSTVDDTITFTHTADAVNGDSYSVVPTTPGIIVVVNKVDNYSIEVSVSSDLAGFVKYSGGLFDWDAGTPNFIADSQAGISFSESGGTLTVNHPSAINYDVQLTQFGEYIPRVSNVSAASFDVEFYDYSGVKIAVADTNMKVWIKRKVALKGKLPFGASFNVRGPVLAIRSAALSNVGGSNFWVTGTMQK